MNGFEAVGIIAVVLICMGLIAGYGTWIEETRGDRRRAQGDPIKHAKATRKWMFAIFFPVIWPVALVVWIVKGIVRGLVALVNVFQQMKIGKKLSEEK